MFFDIDTRNKKYIPHQKKSITIYKHDETSCSPFKCPDFQMIWQNKYHKKQKYFSDNKYYNNSFYNRNYDEDEDYPYEFFYNYRMDSRNFTVKEFIDFKQKRKYERYHDYDKGTKLNDVHIYSKEKYNSFSKKKSKSRRFLNTHLNHRCYELNAAQGETKNNCMMITVKSIVKNGKVFLIETCKRIAKKSKSRFSKTKKIIKKNNSKKRRAERIF